MKRIILTVLLAALIKISPACTNFLVTKSVSGGCGNLISYAADSHQLYGALYFYPEQDHPHGSFREIYDWDSGKYMGRIPEAAHTFNVVGNMNSKQVSIAETTYGGLDTLQSQDGAIIDYGSMIYIALQRAETARQAIKIMAELAEKYGYASEGESFSIADKNEVWIMEVIGKGNFEKGMVWVARRVPEGYICAHANQARITTFNYQKVNKFDDPKADTFNSHDVIQFAIDHNFYKGSFKDFSFSDVYNPVDFEGARFCDIRVWAFFAAADPDGFGKKSSYWDYAKGNVEREIKYEKGQCQTKKNFPTNRLPLWIKPKYFVTTHGLMNQMRNHLEGTELDMSKDFGAGAFNCPYRYRPLTFEVNGKEYLNERATATQQTGWVFVSQMRNWMPDYCGGIFWFATDDAANTVFAPFYSTINKVPVEYSSENGSMIKWSENSSFWINNLIANFAYSRYRLIHPEIEKVQQRQEEEFIFKTSQTDKLVMNDPENAVKILTEFSCNTASDLVKSRKELFAKLFMKFMDGNCKETDENLNIIDNGNGFDIPKVKYPGYGEKWQEEVVKHTGEKLLIKNE